VKTWHPTRKEGQRLTVFENRSAKKKYKHFMELSSNLLGRTEEIHEKDPLPRARLEPCIPNKDQTRLRRVSIVRNCLSYNDS